MTSPPVTTEQAPATNRRGGVSTMNLSEFFADRRLAHRSGCTFDALLKRDDISASLAERLLRLKAESRVGDRLIYYCADRESFDTGLGSEGYVLVRDDEVIGSVIRRMR